MKLTLLHSSSSTKRRPKQYSYRRLSYIVNTPLMEGNIYRVVQNNAPLHAENLWKGVVAAINYVAALVLVLSLPSSASGEEACGSVYV